MPSPRKTVKTVRPLGATAGIVTYSRSRVPAKKRLQETKPFSLKKWAKFWEPDVPNATRLGIILTIPYLEPDPAEEIVLMRHVLMPLTDGLAEEMFANESQSSTGVAGQLKRVSVARLRIEAWLVLAECFFSASKEPYVWRLIARKGFVDDMIAFFQKNESGFRQTNASAIHLSNETPVAKDEEDGPNDQGQREARAALAERVKKAHVGMITYLKSFFVTAWNYTEKMQYSEMDRGEVQRVHDEVSTEKRIELFETLIGIDPEWLRMLPWGQRDFTDVVQFLISKTKRESLQDLAALNTGTCEPPLKTSVIVARILIRVAFDNGWSTLNRVLR